MAEILKKEINVLTLLPIFRNQLVRSHSTQQTSIYFR
jgi:hypothetical protein